MHVRSLLLLQITPSPEPKEEEDMEFIIVRDEFSDDEPVAEPERKSVRSFRSFRSLESKDTETSMEDMVTALHSIRHVAVLWVLVV